MNDKNWKTLAIVFMVLFVLETAFVGWSLWYANSENEKYMDCLYDVCGDYPEAWYEDGLCYCYDYDILGDLFVAKTKMMK